jgi:hypothetical protein
VVAGGFNNLCAGMATGTVKDDQRGTRCHPQNAQGVMRSVLRQSNGGQADQFFGGNQKTGRHEQSGHCGCGRTRGAAKENGS